MKKKLIVICTLLLLMFTVVPFSYADSTVYENTAITETFFEDGSYAILETIESPQVTRALQKSGKPTYTYYNAKNFKQWTFTLSATFAYNGSTAKALSASKNYTVSNGWSCISNTKKLNDATATGNATFKKRKITAKKSQIKIQHIKLYEN